MNDVIFTMSSSKKVIQIVADNNDYVITLLNDINQYINVIKKVTIYNSIL